MADKQPAEFRIHYRLPVSLPQTRERAGPPRTVTPHLAPLVESDVASTVAVQIAAEPRDLYSDFVTFHEDRGVLRICFHCTRPDNTNMIGEPTISVARVSFHFKMFRYYFEEWLKSQAGLDALSE